MNESVISIILRYGKILFSEILMWVLQLRSWDNKVKIAEPYFDVIGPEKHTKNQAARLGHGGFPLFSYFDPLDTRGYSV